MATAVKPVCMLSGAQGQDAAARGLAHTQLVLSEIAHFTDEEAEATGGLHRGLCDPSGGVGGAEPSLPTASATRAFCTRDTERMWGDGVEEGSPARVPRLQDRAPWRLTQRPLFLLGPEAQGQVQRGQGHARHGAGALHARRLCPPGLLPVRLSSPFLSSEDTWRGHRVRAPLESRVTPPNLIIPAKSLLPHQGAPRASGDVNLGGPMCPTMVTPPVRRLPTRPADGAAPTVSCYPSYWGYFSSELSPCCWTSRGAQGLPG